jgi:hypothetical protein
LFLIPFLDRTHNSQATEKDVRVAACSHSASFLLADIEEGSLVQNGMFLQLDPHFITREIERSPPLSVNSAYR